MISLPRLGRSRFFRIATMASAAALLAACSTSMERLADYPPVGNTASVSKSQATGSGAVASRPLDNTNVATATRPSWQNGAATSAKPRSTYTTAASGSLVVKPGQTAYSIARANNISVARLASANNLPAPYAVKVGQRLVIPGVSRPVSPAATFRPQQVQAAYARPDRANFANKSGAHRVRPGETLYSLGRTYKVHPNRLASFNGLNRNAGLRVGQIIRIPAQGDAWSAPANRRNSAAAQPAPQPQPRVADTEDAAPPPVKEAPVRNENSGSGTFRWPVAGRVISGFGPRANGSRNEGINIAVPEGAAVRAAGNGVVAYAGNELKAYGNLILIRHPNGWVTAYAHNKQLLVRRGDMVRRGQTIARAGQTGSVSSPQLHFELRKGATAVNPLRYLSSRTASN